ncbi:olfactomedin-4-like [Diretmus argenteus]
MLLLLLLLSATAVVQSEPVSGQLKNGACECPVNSSIWLFPAAKYEAALQLVQTCGDSLEVLQAKVRLSIQRLPHFQALVRNLTARLEIYQYLTDKGLFSVLDLDRLGQEFQKLETDVITIHTERNTALTRKLSKEVSKLRIDIERLHTSDIINMKTVKEKMRHLKNRAESCRSIPNDFTSHCFKGLINNISTPVTSRVSPNGKGYPGSWGKQAQRNSPAERDSYWVQPLTASSAWGANMYLYPSYEDFMSATKVQNFPIAPVTNHANSIEGPSGVLYGDAFYYHCYRSADVCRYNLTSKTVTRVTLPGTGVGFNNKFPYCYYECHGYSDVDVEADETGLWAIYATLGNHGNIVVSRLVWYGEVLNVTQTWETTLFKKAVSSAFMACGVLYATRYVDEYREEVFYAFDTVSGREDNSLALPLQKVAKGVTSLSYNPTDKQIYMYNNGYLLAYQAQFSSSS